ncbi:hypothetical protein predicted by Glimmer/Critica [Sorangium cellulosum So ce56]|uniref:Uncharacterized protein n=1 Tax=Sorangium cellulosum (strain So ce56) TaxID=448385 RepID=A9GCR8_SORC5|nr:hypothetical protein predicted by Glimmer/Critica [Sorangium cellulosum So ce56]
MLAATSQDHLARSPEGICERAVRKVMSPCWAHGDRAAPRILAACAPWMALVDAARVISNELGNDWTGIRLG